MIMQILQYRPMSLDAIYPTAVDVVHPAEEENHYATGYLRNNVVCTRALDVYIQETLLLSPYTPFSLSTGITILVPCTLVVVAVSLRPDLYISPYYILENTELDTTPRSLYIVGTSHKSLTVTRGEQLARLSFHTLSSELLVEHFQ